MRATRMAGFGGFATGSLRTQIGREPTSAHKDATHGEGSPMGMFSSYLDTVDTKAFQNVGTDYGSREAPILPLIAPWAVAGPFLYLLRDHQQPWFYLFVCASVVSVTAYGVMMWFYIRAKQRYRKEMGLPDWREKMRQKIEDDMANLD